MSSYDYIRGKGNRFSRDNQPPNRGRKPSVITKMKRIGLTGDDIAKLMENLLVSDERKAKSMLGDPDLPILAVGYLRALVMDAKAGKVDTLERMLDRLYGKAVRKSELTGKDGKDLLPEPLAIEIIDSRDKVDDEEVNKAGFRYGEGKDEAADD